MRLIFSTFCFLLFVIIYSSCSSDKKNSTNTLNPGNLETYAVSINVTRDTVLKTQEGVMIQIPAYGLYAGGKTVAKLEIREAINICEMIKAGLLTQTNGKPLSSGGMIQIVASAGQSVKIMKAIGVRIPTPYIDPNMQVYKGVTTDDVVTDWTDPRPLIKNADAEKLDSGKILFMAHCSSCHGIAQSVTGPPLAYISRLRKKDWLYAFTRNNSAVMANGDRYALCMNSVYGQMSIYPWSDQQLDAVYHYIDNESERLGLALPADHLKKCVDSCHWYELEHEKLANRRNKLINDNGNQIAITNTPTKSPTTVSGSPNIVVPQTKLQKVIPENYESVYYQFSIEEFGWYNIDALVSETLGVKKSELILRLQGTYTREINVFLIIPNSRIFQQGGHLSGKENDYGFYTMDGSIYLQQSVKASVMAMGEKDGKIFFDMASFQTSEKQTLTLSPSVVTKDQMNSMLKSLDLPDINMQVQDSKNADSIRVVDVQLKDLERFKPKTCDCGCGRISDTSNLPKEQADYYLHYDSLNSNPK
jgi:mono/diheme cytochrome c family protein